MTITGVRIVAELLTDLDDDSVAELLRSRGGLRRTSWRDLFDVAESLVEPASIERAIRGLPREVLSLLASGTVSDEKQAPVVIRSLIDRDGVVLPEVSALLPDAAISPPADADEVAPPASSDDEAAAAEAAFLSTTLLTDLVYLSQRRGLSRIASGSLSAIERRRLVESGVTAEGDHLDVMSWVAQLVGLLDGQGKELRPAPDADEWLQLPGLTRWSRVAHRLVEALPLGVRRGPSVLPIAQWDAQYPLDPEWPERSARWRRAAELFGLVTASGAIPSWAAGISSEPDLARLAQHLPHEVDTIFVQNDLSAISPGPLHAADEYRLRGIADRDYRAGAYAYRFSPESIGRAVDTGESAGSITEFLSALAQSPLPQAVRYVIERVATEHGSVRVTAAAADGSGGTRVVSADSTLLAAIRVDQRLRVFGFVPVRDALVSSAPPRAVIAALIDARYPAVLDETAPHPAQHVTAAEDATDDVGDLVRRLRTQTPAPDDDAWLGRHIERAVRDRSVIDVVVTMPDGARREFRMEAAGLGGGRLRGRDLGADVERTLPVSMIESVRLHPERQDPAAR